MSTRRQQSRRLRSLLLVLGLLTLSSLSACEWLQNEFLYIDDNGESLELLFEQQRPH